MGNRVTSMLQDEEIQIISEETGFSAMQIEKLYSRFTSLDKSGICGSLSRQDFLRVPELAINPLCDRIVHMFFVDCDEDHERINFRQFMKVLATFRSSAKPIRSRNASRQESFQNILSSLTQNDFRHSRHSSCDNFFNYYPVQHHTTNQHSIHYVASTTHLAPSQHHPYSFLNHSNNNNNNNNNNINNNHNNNHSNGNNLNSSNSNGSFSQFKKPCSKCSLLDEDEPANSLRQKLYFMFKVYDVNNDNLIDLEDIVAILRMMVGTYVEDARVLRIAERSLREADKNCDGYVDFEEFCSSFTRKDIVESLRVKFTTLDK